MADKIAPHKKAVRVKKKPLVAMFGPDLGLKGGISFVVLEYLKAGLHRKMPFIFIPTTTEGSRIKNALFFLKCIIITLRTMMRSRVDICHLHVSHYGSFYRKWVIFRIAKIFRCKVMVHIHGSNFERFMTENSFNRWMTRTVFNRADRVIVLSDEWKAGIEKFADKSHVVKLFNPAPRPRWVAVDHTRSALNILFLGRLSTRKGVYDLLECIGARRAFYEELGVRFTIAGDGDVDAVRAIVNRDGLNAIVNVPGWISGKVKERYLSNADIYVLPSYHEQLPMSILEAMAYGLPIVSTWVAGIPELVEDGVNGHLVDPGDIDGLGNALRTLVMSKEKRLSMGRESRQRVAGIFDAEKMITRELTALYERL
ncbi:glycosyltransferase [Desulfococcus multivorans]|uniref:glycosyltransferase n=1 Tax=Desulfococcus multivorans TaxID=897 RepID=UPI0014740733|nr:glycosyltransferase [Desulfococcus multivorans]